MGVKYVQAWEEKKLERQEGRKEGLQDGLEKGRFEALGDLVADGTLSLEAAANRSKGKREEFLNWYRTYKC